MAKTDKIIETLQSYIYENYPDEKLHEAFFVSEEPNAWLRRFLLGTAISVAATKYSYIGITEKRILLMSTSNHEDVTQILLGQIYEIKFDGGILSGKLIIDYREDIRRVFIVNSGDFDKADNFVKVYSQLPVPTLSVQEENEAKQIESDYKLDHGSRIGLAIFIAIVIGLFFLVMSYISSSEDKDFFITETIDQNYYTSIEELYRNIPANATEREDWEQWENDYIEKYVKGTGKFLSVSIHPQVGKLFFIVTISGDNDTEENSIQIALMVEDARTIALGNEEGSFLINDTKWIKLGETYDFEGRTSIYSLFDTELVSAGYSDLVIIRAKTLDISGK